MRSVVRGNRNWFIHVYIDDERIHCGRPGNAGYNEFSCYLSDIPKHRWYYFTYKKDFEKMLKIFEDNGYIIRWV